MVRLAEVLGLSVGEILAGQRIQVYTPETVDTLAKESIEAYSGSERRRMLRRMGAVLAVLALYIYWGNTNIKTDAVTYTSAALPASVSPTTV